MFILPCWFGDLILFFKKGHKIVDSFQLQNWYKTTYCTDVSLCIYTHTVQDAQGVNIQVEAGSMTTLSGVAEMTKSRINHLFPI